MYSTPLDVRMALTPGADLSDKSTAAGLSEQQIIDAILEADGVINAHLLRLYSIPVSDIVEANPAPADPQNPDPATITSNVAPRPVRGWSRDIAAYLATLTFKRNQDVTKDDPVRLRYTQAMEMLVAIRDRKMFLDTDIFPPVDTGDISEVTVVNLYEGKLFSLSDFGLAPENSNQAQVLLPRYRDL